MGGYTLLLTLDKRGKPSRFFKKDPRTGLTNSFVARLTRCEARRGKRAKKPEVYPLRYTEDFFAEFDEGAARISPTGAKAIFEAGSSYFATLDRGISLRFSVNRYIPQTTHQPVVLRPRLR